MISKNIYIDVMEELTVLCHQAHLASSTIRKKHGILSRLFRSLTEFSLTALQKWLECYISPRTKQKLGPHGHNAYIIEIKWFLKRTHLPFFHGKKTDILQGLTRKSVKSPGKSISSEDFEHLLQYSPSVVHDLAFRLMYECGFRPHELLSIRLQDVTATTLGEEKNVMLINLPDKNPYVPSGKNKTGGRPVLVIQNYRNLQHYLEKIRKGTYTPATRLFPWKHRTLSVTYCRMKSCCAHQKRTQRSSNENLFKNTKNQTAMHQQYGRLYDLRHTAITQLYLQGIPDQVIRRTVGWTPSSRMPDVYVHVQEVHLKHAFQILYQPSKHQNL
jgi:integrase